MTTYQILTLLGLGSLITSTWFYMFRFARKVTTSIKAVKLGVQAALRAQMIDDYNYYSEKGCAPIYARDSFTNCWNQYETLGKNNVMEDVYMKFMALPYPPADHSN